MLAVMTSKLILAEIGVKWQGWQNSCHVNQISCCFKS